MYEWSVSQIMQSSLYGSAKDLLASYRHMAKVADSAPVTRDEWHLSREHMRRLA